MRGERIITLEEYTIEMQKNFPNATGDLSKILRDISLAAKIVNREVNKAGLVDMLGTTGDNNTHGEEVKKLDVFANEEFIEAISVGGQCCGIASEENEEFIPITTENTKNAKYVVAMDPLDGSSNIDVNVSIGTIFSIYRRASLTGDCVLEDFMQRGDRQIAAGYIIYGSSTMMVYTTGFGVHGFTLDPSVGEFYLSHPDLKIPEQGTIYSVNQGNYSLFDEGVKHYIRWCEESSEEKKPYSLRYIGSMVADLHRNLINGGIFIYPSTKIVPEGKLRLLYECNPMSFITEQAGGKSTNGSKRILEIQPTELHERTPIFIGSKKMVERAEEFLLKYSEADIS
ncbi:MAG: class 1 fructose-bisphosphatase [Bacteroidetes bacterium]|nr:class 1 fructose-bisphosphatase [Bacteroidota bacterium]